MDRELEGLRLELEREKISGEVYPQVTELNLAERELKLALERLEKGQQEYDQKEREYGEELERLKSEYEKKQAMTRVGASGFPRIRRRRQSDRSFPLPRAPEMPLFGRRPAEWRIWRKGWPK